MSHIGARAAFRTLSLTFLLFAASQGPAHAGAWSLAPGEYYSEFRGGFFSADSYLDPDGGRRTLVGGGKWQERSLLSYNEIGWKKHVSFILGIPAKTVTRTFAGPTDSVYRPSATGFADGLIGFRYSLMNQATAFAIEFDWSPPLGYTRNTFVTGADSARCGDSDGDGDSLDVNCLQQVGSPRLGQGRENATLWVRFGAPLLGRGFLDLSGGYRHQLDRQKNTATVITPDGPQELTFGGPRDQVVANADLGIWLTRSLLVGGRYQGEVTASKSDRASDNTDRHRVGPMLVYHVDDRMQVIASSLHTASASNALHTDEFSIGVAFQFTRLNRLQGLLGTSAAAGP